MKLYYAQTINPRKACAAARYLNSPVEFVHVDLRQGEHKQPGFLALNPNGRVPVLQDGDWSLWEANAIMCFLSDRAQADFWPHDARQIDVLRWLSWDARHFTRHTGTLYFENLIKPALGMGGPDSAVVAEATRNLNVSAKVLDDHLANNDFLVGNSPSVADFAAGSCLPYSEGAKLPFDDFGNINRWNARLNDIPAWQSPFG
jgi:glutathione S-transferase